MTDDMFIDGYFTQRFEAGEEPSYGTPSAPASRAKQLRHYPRRPPIGGEVEIVDRESDFVRAVLPCDDRFTCNAQQWDAAKRICAALEGPMIPQGAPASGAPSNQWREVCGVLRGLMYYADGHGLRARDARRLSDLKSRADKVIAALASATEGEGK